MSFTLKERNFMKCLAQIEIIITKHFLRESAEGWRSVEVEEHILYTEGWRSVEVEEHVLYTCLRGMLCFWAE
jgi:hypothetical protein